jgi:hypothetical protein
VFRILVGFSTLIASLFLTSVDAFSQSLSLSSATLAAGGKVSLNLSLSSPAGTEPAVIGWTLAYPAANITALTVAAGPSAVAAGKSLSCSAGASSYNCVLWGMSQTIVPNGIVATASLTLSPSAGTTAVAVSNAVGATPGGSSETVTTAGGSINVNAPATLTVSTLTCNPTTLGPSAATACAVSLSGAAPAGGAVVALQSSSAALSVPASVTVPAGATSTSVTATAASFTVDSTATLTATLNGSSKSSVVSLSAAVAVTSVSCIPSSLQSKATATCTVALSTAAPAGGAGVSLSSSTTALTVAGSVTVGAGATSATFNATAGTFSSAQTATITASLNGSTVTAKVSLILPTTVTLSSLACSPTALLSAGTTTCTVTLSSAAGSTGAAVAITSGSTVLTAPTSVTVPASATTASFTATAGTVAVAQSATLTASIGSSSASATISLTVPTATAPGTVFSLAGSATEVSGRTNGSSVKPAVAPAGLAGSVVIDGTGSVNFVSGAGVYFLNCCTNTNTAYYKFTGSGVGKLFAASQAQVSFTLQSRYTFAQRKSRPADMRYAFDARDANGHQYYFLTQIASGYLDFTYMVAGSIQHYFVPAGTEDRLFGSGVTMNVKIKWDGKTVSLLLNDAVVQTTTYVPATMNWSAASIFDIGAYEYMSFGGWNASDDVIGNFVLTSSSTSTASIPAPTPGPTPTASASTLLQILGEATEAAGKSNGSVVTTAIAPAGFSGAVVANGAGTVNYVPGSGVYFANCCTNTNNAYYRFGGSAVGSVFGAAQGQISFMLTSRRSFAERSQSAGDARYAFDVRDANGHQCYFLTLVASGYLQFTYAIDGAAYNYYVPTGTEDQLFGRGVSLNVTIKWDGLHKFLLLNGNQVQATDYTAVAKNWTDASVFDLGAYEYQASGGWNGSDDLIRNFTVSQ